MKNYFEEDVNFDFGPVTYRWMQTPPEMGMWFSVLDEEWIKQDDGKYVRVIKKFELAETSITNEPRP